MSTMRVVSITAPGGPDVMKLVERPLPAPLAGEVRVKVRATAVNRADLLQRMGHYPAPPDVPADVPGLEYAGVVDALGEGVTGLAVGDRVFGLVGGGAYAEALTVHARATARIPDALSFEEAAAMPEAYLTAYDALVSQAGLAGGETVLVHAVGSGVGTAAVQLCRALGARVVGTARTPDKLERARGLGMHDGVLVGSDGKFADRVRALGGAAVVLELVGGAYVEEDLRCLQPEGRVVVVGLSAGTRSTLDLGQLLARRARIFGTVLRSRPLEEKIGVMRTFAHAVVPMIERGLLEPVIDTVMPLDEVGRAHERVGKNETFGKIVLTTAAS